MPIPTRNDWQTERDELTHLLDGLSDKEVHELSIRALRNLHRQHKLQDGSVQFPSGFGETFVTTLAAHRGVARNAPNFSQLFQDDFGHVYMLPIVEFVMWMARAGLAWPIYRGTASPITLKLSRAGQHFVALDHDDHPLMPTYVERIKERCLGLPDSVTSLLMQSKSCLDHALMRPAVSLMGVAYEAAAEEVVEKLIRRRKLTLQHRGLSAVDRIATVKGMIDAQLLPGRGQKKAEIRRAAHAAWDFADRLRARRNDASHPTPAYGFEVREEAEEFLISAGRHLPGFWRVTRK